MALSTDLFTIPDEGTTSNAIQCGADSLIGVILPADAGITGTSISFEGSLDGTTFYPIYDGGSLVTVSVQTAAAWNVLSVEKIHGPQWIRVKSTATESAGPIVITPVWRAYF